MSWFQQNRFLGTFLIALGCATLSSGYFLRHEKGAAAVQQARLNATINELNRLRASVPFPNEENLRKTEAQTDSYRTSLQALEAELKTRVLPEMPLQPNEFQAQLRQAVLAVSERALASKVQLPENFNLGFDEYATSLPNGMVARRLGQQLRAIEWLTNAIVDARVDSLDTLSRSALPEEKAAATAVPLPGKNRGTAASETVDENAKIVESTSLSLVFTGSQAATRRVLNQTSSAKEHFYIIRTLQVKNQVDRGPKRGAAAVPREPAVSRSIPGATGKATEPRITFIVGDEHLSVAATIEVVRFNLLEKEAH